MTTGTGIIDLVIFLWVTAFALWIGRELFGAIRRLLEPAPPRYEFERDGERVIVRLAGIEARVK